MLLLISLIVLASPESERLLLGPSPFFRHEGMLRAVREDDVALLHKAALSKYWDARRFAAQGLGARTPTELLSDPVAVVREAAVRALDVRAPEADLLRLLKDKDDAVRAAAAWALRERTNRTPLRPLLKDPSSDVRIAALGATGRFATLRKLATRRSLAQSVPALRMLGRAGGSADAALLLRRLRALVRELNSGRAAAVPLHLREQPSQAMALARAVGDMARRDLKIGGRSLRVLLHELVAKTPPTGTVALVLAQAVAGARDVTSARVILDAMLTHYRTTQAATAYPRIAIKDVLHTFSREPWPEIAPLLFPYLTHRDAVVRAAGARAMFGDAVRPALRDKSPVVRAVACGQVGKLGPLLDVASTETEPAVLAACARALGRLGDGAAAEVLGGLVRHDDFRVRLAAVGALMRSPSHKRGEVLYAAARDDDSLPVRAAATAVLDFLEEDERAIPWAIRDLGHDRAAARTNALALLHTLTAAKFGYDPQAPTVGKAHWEAWWKRRTERPRRTGGFTYHVDDLRRKGIDLVLVIDATSSMSGVIQSTKARLKSVVEQLRRVVPDLRVRIVAYRDKSTNPRYPEAFLTLGSPLTHDTRVLEDFIAGISAYGGGDAPEAVLAGLRDAIEKTPWRPGTYRIVLLFGDAPPHARDETLLKTILGEFKGVVHAVDVGGYNVGGVQYAYQSFQKIAAWGRGVALEMSNEGELIRNLLVLTLGPRFRTAVETLFGL